MPHEKTCTVRCASVFIPCMGHCVLDALVLCFAECGAAWGSWMSAGWGPLLELILGKAMWAEVGGHGGEV
jgi:hypothetical protein